MNEKTVRTLCIGCVHCNCDPVLDDACYVCGDCDDFYDGDPASPADSCMDDICRNSGQCAWSCDDELHLPTKGSTMLDRLTAGLPLLVIYIGSVVLANYLTVHDGLVSIGFGLVCTAGTLAVGGAILTRDLLQDALGRVIVLTAIVVGALLSWAVADAHIAVASGVTFLIAESIEFAVYTPLRQRVGFATPRWSGVVAVANVTGALADTFLFLWLAGFPITGDVVGGQLLGKLYLTAAVIFVAPMVRGAVRPKVATA